MGVKREFGTKVSRLLQGGVKLTDAEHSIVCALVDALPPQLKCVVEHQFELYNLVQREVDQRGLNFYLKMGGTVSLEGLPLLSHKGIEAPLVRIRAKLGTTSTPVRAVLTAVNGRAFQVTLDRRLSVLEHLESVHVEETVQAWRSNFVVTEA
jgi:hypothetical protein